ncbi:66_t:CDS:2, partial [Gigaspora rosea]
KGENSKTSNAKSSKILQNLRTGNMYLLDNIKVESMDKSYEFQPNAKENISRRTTFSENTEEYKTF